MSKTDTLSNLIWNTASVEGELEATVQAVSVTPAAPAAPEDDGEEAIEEAGTKVLSKKEKEKLKKEREKVRSP